MAPRAAVSAPRPGLRLFYVTGGAAFVNFRTGLENSAAGLPAGSVITNDTRSETKAGWTFGGGTEVALDARWSAKLEYLYIDAGKSQRTFTGVDPRRTHGHRQQRLRQPVSRHPRRPELQLQRAGDRKVLERFRAKWTPVRGKKTRQNKNLEPGSEFNQNRKDSDEQDWISNRPGPDRPGLFCAAAAAAGACPKMRELRHFGYRPPR